MAAIHNLPCVVCFAKDLKQTTRTIAHHKIGMGIGKKSSDLLTAAICSDCHTGKDGIHNIPLWKWEKQNMSQNELIKLTNELLQEIS